MLKLLLDEHVPPALVTALQGGRPQLAAIALRDWYDGLYLLADDATILSTAREDGLTLVTYDLRTIPRLLKEWAEQGSSHGGVVFVHRRTVPPSDIGGLARALISLWDVEGEDHWADRVVFLQA